MRHDEESFVQGGAMIKHVVMWKIKEHAAGVSKLENILTMKLMLEELRTMIPGIRDLEVGTELKPGNAKYDVVLVTEVDDWDSLERYQHHPDHVKVAEFIGKIREQRAVVDYEVVPTETVKEYESSGPA